MTTLRSGGTELTTYYGCLEPRALFRLHQGAEARWFRADPDTAFWDEVDSVPGEQPEPNLVEISRHEDE